MTIFLDVDGVLNAVWRSVSQPKSYRVTGWKDWEQTKISVQKDSMKISYPFAVSHEMAKAIMALDVDIVWATTWITQIELEDIANFVGLPNNLPRISSCVRSDTESCGKLEGVASYVETHDITKFVWIDDELGETDKFWAEDYESLLIKPRSLWGLTRDSVSQIKSFLES